MAKASSTPKASPAKASATPPAPKAKVTAATTSQKTKDAIPSEASSVLEAGIEIMLDFAVRRSIPLLPSLSTAGVSTTKLDNLARYNILVDAVKPATVHSIRYIDAHVTREAGSKVDLFKIPVFTKCIAIAAVALVVLIGISLFPSVNEANQSKGLLASSGLTLLANLGFVCSASLLGVMFYLLKTVSDKIKNYSLLPIDTIEINTTILIGLISGFIISEMFTVPENAIGNSVALHKMTLALLGGFSSDAIFTILQGVVNKAKNFLTSSP